VYRSNEAIDQAVAESLAFFSAQIESERNLFLGMLGHDMRGLLQVIQLTATHLSKLDGLAGEVVFSVHNQGLKIEHSVIAQIFEPLMRGLDHPLIAGSDGSMGLGLYIAREIAIARLPSYRRDLCPTDALSVPASSLFPSPVGDPNSAIASGIVAG
jgi:hypothetical protein